MESGDEAIAHLIARGFHAQHWDCYAPGAFAVASTAIDIGDDIIILQHTVVVVPVVGGWSVRCEFPAGVEGVSLAEAVDAAAALVSEMLEFGLPKCCRAAPGAAADRGRSQALRNSSRSSGAGG